MSLRKEEIKGIGLTVNEAEPIEIDGLVDGRVNPPDVDHQLAIHEHPDIVITRESEVIVLAGVIGEFRVKLECEVEVVIRASSRVAEQITVNGKETTQLAEIRIGLVVEDIAAVTLPIECQLERHGEIDAGNVPIPLIEAFGGLDATGIRTPFPPLAISQRPV